MNIVVVTGTGTGVGKTVTTAALAACALGAGQRVAVVKPVQTGVSPGEPADLAEVSRLTGLTDLHEYARYPEPLAPATAARRLGESGPDLAELAVRVAGLADRDLVIIEGAGGVLVRFNDRGEGICELAGAVRQLASAEDGGAAGFQAPGVEAPGFETPGFEAPGFKTPGAEAPRFEVVLVTTASLGCLHHAAASADALRKRGWGPHHLVVGDWPAQPGLAERCNLVDLPSYTGTPLHGVIGHGAGGLERAAFTEVALRSLPPVLGGSFDAADFVRRHAAPEPMRVSSR
ncbi:ATP-dependent dethiobiotin synthetase BioD [Jatrophihabitans sp.]|uniref:ATP-dependent dethiobiotin synthetase BioD n=1 Tax=Jatrophihabitans sp. TaxID=1932789 RepID=UPI002EFA896D